MASAVFRRGKTSLKCSTGRQIGRGVAGDVYETCCNSTCRYVTKVVHRNLQAAVREAQLQQAAARAGLAPHIVYSKCGAGCIIVMERVDTTLDAYLSSKLTLTTVQQNKILDALEKLARLRIDHGDVHAGNIGIDLRPWRVRVIDFSEAKRVAKVDVRAQLAKLVGDLRHRFPQSRFHVFEKALKTYDLKRETCDDEGVFVAAARTLVPESVADDDTLLNMWMDMNDTRDCRKVVAKVAAKLMKRRLPART
ncbi:MAG: hypothetical protein EBZ91_12550 [Gammaproteobacteria bacterium]|nr:hypothetical protein [Gammaproteobacteria bacterium]